MDDRDLDDAALWASVDTAVAEASRRALPMPPPSSPAVSLWPAPHDDPHRGEVLQPARPFKLPRVAASHGRGRGRATPPPPPPSPSSPPPYMAPDASRPLMLVQSPHPELPWVTEPGAAGSPVAAAPAAHGLFPSAAASVASFRKYQEVAVSILDKSDYTVISGNPYIKKSGWRKISCFYNISFEIKDHSIEFDDSHNVNCAEFLVRASMQSGRFSDGWGSCDRREKRFNKPNHDIPSTAETRAKNKACQDLLGIGHNRPG
ncbi:hypothetical protein CFC21_015152 [Triticum aestivum]|uniref:Uncharacterized protein n=2 Tax=Triticum aestivum TaxID=4565 RepID=A0A9R1DVP8_WHEAT|nr:uncharacterized protein LOC123187294 isoform X1 [Triticum aestivum]KAF6999078.1 hypothetical protein CFC21_015152 [Triticum aestivum]